MSESNPGVYDVIKLHHDINCDPCRLTRLGIDELRAALAEKEKEAQWLRENLTKTTVLLGREVGWRCEADEKVKAAEKERDALSLKCQGLIIEREAVRQEAKELREERDCYKSQLLMGTPSAELLRRAMTAEEAHKHYIALLGQSQEENNTKDRQLAEMAAEVERLKAQWIDHTKPGCGPSSAYCEELRLKVVEMEKKLERARTIIPWISRRNMGWEIKTPAGQSAFWPERSGIVAHVIDDFLVALLNALPAPTKAPQ